MSEYRRWRPIVWRIIAGLLAVFWLGAVAFCARAMATELPRDMSLWPREGLSLTRYYPDAAAVNRFCNPDDPRRFVSACVRGGVIHQETPCNYVHEKHARETCHELIHALLKLVHKEGGARLVWYDPSEANAK